VHGVSAGAAADVQNPASHPLARQPVKWPPTVRPGKASRRVLHEEVTIVAFENLVGDTTPAAGRPTPGKEATEGVTLDGTISGLQRGSSPQTRVGVVVMNQDRPIFGPTGRDGKYTGRICVADFCRVAGTVLAGAGL
jgi:hypothetical protein